MRRLNITPYKVAVPDPSKPGTTVEVPFDVKGSMITVLFGKGVEGRQLLKCAAIAKKIEGATGASVLMEEADYRILEAAFVAWPTFTRNEVELFSRVQDAPIVPVKEAKGLRKAPD